MRNFIDELPHELLNDLRIRILTNKEILGKLQNCMAHSLMHSLPCRNKFWALTLKIHAKTDIKIIRFCLALLDI